MNQKAMLEGKSSLRRWGAVCMLASLLCFTANALMLKHLGTSQTSSWLALAFRATIGLAMVIAFFNRDGQVNFWRAATNRMHICRGAFGVIGTAAYYFTISELGAGKATLISNTYVVLSAVLAVWLLREPMRGISMIGIAIAIAGLYLLLNLNSRQWNTIGRFEAIAMAGALSAAAAVIAIKQLTRTDNSATIFASQCIFVSLISVPFALQHLNELTTSVVAWLSLAGLSAGLGQLAMTEGFRHLSVAVGGAFQILVPMFIAVGGVLLFDESFTLWQILGAALILVGSYCAIVDR